MSVIIAPIRDRKQAITWQEISTFKIIQQDDIKFKIFHRQDFRSISGSHTTFPFLFRSHVNRSPSFQPIIPISRIYDLFSQGCFHTDFFCLPFYQFLILYKIYINLCIVIIMLEFFKSEVSQKCAPPITFIQVDIFFQYLNFLWTI